MKERMEADKSKSDSGKKAFYFYDLICLSSFIVLIQTKFLSEFRLQLDAGKRFFAIVPR